MREGEEWRVKGSFSCVYRSRSRAYSNVYSEWVTNVGSLCRVLNHKCINFRIYN